jgi:hypothetical protein
MWLRTSGCLGVAIAAAKLRGFDWSFLVFVIGLYALPVFVFWDTIAFNLFPPTKFEPVQSPFQTLGIGQS